MRVGRLRTGRRRPSTRRIDRVRVSSSSPPGRGCGQARSLETAPVLRRPADNSVAGLDGDFVAAWDSARGGRRPWAGVCVALRGISVADFHSRRAQESAPPASWVTAARDTRDARRNVHVDRMLGIAAKHNLQWSRRSPSHRKSRHYVPQLLPGLARFSGMGNNPSRGDNRLRYAFAPALVGRRNGD